MLKKLLKEIFSQKGIYLLLLVGIIHQIIFVFVPYLSKYYIDFIQNKNLGKDFWNLIYLGVLMLIINLFLGVFKDYYKEGFIKKYENNLILNYFKRFFALDYEYRNTEGTGKTITKINRGVESQVSLVNSLYNVIVILFVRAIIIGSVVFSLYKPLFGVIFFAIILLIFINKYLSLKIKKLTQKEQEISEEVGKQTNKMIMESNLIKIGNKVFYELDILKNILSLLPNLKQKIYLNNSSIYIFLDIIFNLVELLCYAFLGILVVKSQMTLGEMTMIILYFGWMWWPIQIIVSNVSEYRNQISKYEALENFVNQPNKIKDGEKDFELKSGEIIFDKVNFGYNAEKGIFYNFDLKINGGKTTALVGHSGSGKSTIIKLILRNYISNSGNILIDGQNIKDLKIETFYQNIGYLSQEPAVFDGTIKENLMYGVTSPLTTLLGEERGSESPSTPRERDLGGGIENILWQSLEKVGLYELIKNSKDGLETYVGEKGLKLSGGERQRIALARIFISNPKILILDEPTSALDSISEHKVTQIINEMMKNKTVIVIAHRLQTVMQADNIIVLEKGVIAESGKHNELLEKGGIYSTLVDLQKGVLVE